MIVLIEGSAKLKLMLVDRHVTLEVLEETNRWGTELPEYSGQQRCLGLALHRSEGLKRSTGSREL